MRSLIATMLVACLLGVAPSPSPSPVPTAAVKPFVVHMHDFAFDPLTVTIPAGGTVEWVNDDTVEHSATADDKSWDSGELGAGKSWTHEFAKAGTYAYYCDDHTFMKATIVVR